MKPSSKRPLTLTTWRLCRENRVRLYGGRCEHTKPSLHDLYCVWCGSLYASCGWRRDYMLYNAWRRLNHIAGSD